MINRKTIGYNVLNYMFCVNVFELETNYDPCSNYRISSSKIVFYWVWKNNVIEVLQVGISKKKNICKMYCIMKIAKNLEARLGLKGGGDWKQTKVFNKRKAAEKWFIFSLGDAELLSRKRGQILRTHAVKPQNIVLTLSLAWNALLEKFRNVPGNFWAANLPNFHQ